MSRIEVELVEEEPVEPSPGPERTDERVRRLRWWLVLGVALLVVAAASVQHVVDARRVAQATRFDHVPGVLPRFEGSAAFGSTGEAVDPRQLVPVGPVAVLARTDTTTASVVAFERATARRAWSTRVPLRAEVASSLAQDQTRPAASCRAMGAPGTASWGEHVACEIRPGTVRLPRVDPTQLVVLRTSDGALVDTRPLLAEAWTVAGSHVVTAVAERDETGSESWTVRAGTASGEPVWTWRASAPVARESTTYSASLEASAPGTLLTVRGRWWLLDEDGRLVREGGGPGVGTVPARAGAVLETDSSGSRLVGTEGAQDLRETLLPLLVDDGSAPDTVWFSQPTDDGGQVVARSTATAEVTWRRDLVARSALLLDGRLYVCNERTIAALDARDGTTLWQAARSAPWCDLVTDGRVVVAVDDGLDLAAYGLEDGRERWTAQFALGDVDTAFPPTGLAVTEWPSGLVSLLVPGLPMDVERR